MRIFFILLTVSLFACSTKNVKQEEGKPLSDVEKIARAHGIENFNSINFLQYTFNVQRDTVVHGRTWNWQPKTGQIVYINEGDSSQFFANDVDKVLQPTHHRFINDKYWLLFPFQLVWDSNINATNLGETIAPISKRKLTKITIQYGNEGGYTPGDVYDIFVDSDWIIREWVFRKGGQPEPSLTTTWEGYENMHGMLIATDHRSRDNNFRIFFTDLLLR